MLMEPGQLTKNNNLKDYEIYEELTRTAYKEIQQLR